MNNGNVNNSKLNRLIERYNISDLSKIYKNRFRSRIKLRKYNLEYFRKKQLELKSIIKIQSIFRMYQKRNIYKKEILLIYFKACQNSIIIIQKFIRRFIARKNFKKLLLEEDEELNFCAALMIQNNFKKYLINKKKIL